MQTYTLYRNTKHPILLSFDENRHLYFVDNEPIIGVTTITGVADKSGPLMYWAVRKVTIPYIQEKIKPNTKYDELELNAVFKEAERQYTMHKERAADAGLLMHSWAEDFIRGKKPKKPKNKQLLNAVNAFLDWIKEHKVKFLLSEQKVFSRKYRYAGTYDAVGTIDGKLSMIDFKTNKSGIYDEYRMQVAAYLSAYAEETGVRADSAWIVRFDKETAEFETKCIPIEEHEKDFKAFLGAKDLKQRLLELKRESKQY